MKRWWLLLLLVSLGLNAGLGFRLATGGRGGEVPAITADPGGGPRDLGIGLALADSATWQTGVERRLTRLQRRLGLEGELAARFADIHRVGARHVRGLGRELQMHRRELRASMVAQDLDPALVRLRVAALAAAQARLDSAVAEAMLAELEILPPESQVRYLATIPWQRWGAGEREGRPDHGPRGRGSGRGQGRRSGDGRDGGG